MECIIGGILLALILSTIVSVLYLFRRPFNVTEEDGDLWEKEKDEQRR